MKKKKIKENGFLINFIFFSFVFLHFLNYQTQYPASKKQDTNNTFTQLSKLYTDPTRSICVMIILVL